jgi:hypothetical protein
MVIRHKFVMTLDGIDGHKSMAQCVVSVEMVRGKGLKNALMNEL